MPINRLKTPPRLRKRRFGPAHKLADRHTHAAALCGGYRRRLCACNTPACAEHPGEYPAEYSRTGGAAGRNEHAEALLELLEHRRDARVRAAERAAHLSSKIRVCSLLAAERDLAAVRPHPARSAQPQRG